MVEQKRFKDFLNEASRLSVKDRLKDLMESDSYDDLVDAIHNPKVSIGSICRALTAMGFEVNKAALNRWRKNVKV